MSKFCSSCGNPLEEGAAFCSGCGKPVAAEAPVEPVAPAAPAEAEVAAQPAEAPAAKENPVNKVVDKVQDFSQKATVYVKDYIAKAKENPKMWIAPSAIAVGIIALLVVVIILLSGSKYTTALDTYIDVMFYGNGSKLEQLAPKEYWDYLEENNDMSLDDLKDQFEENVDDRLDMLEDQYGKNVKVTYKITDEDKLSDRKMKKIAEALEDTYDIDAKSVKEGYKVDAEMFIKGSEDDDEGESTFNIIKIGSRWYMISYYDTGDGYRVNFNISGISIG